MITKHSSEAPNPNKMAKGKNTYDAIVIGSGISGGWAAKELTEKGMASDHPP